MLGSFLTEFPALHHRTKFAHTRRANVLYLVPIFYFILSGLVPSVVMPDLRLQGRRRRVHVQLQLDQRHRVLWERVDERRCGP